MYNVYIMVDFFMSPQGRNGAGQNARLVAAKRVAEAKAANLQAPADGVLTDAELAAKYWSDSDRLY